LFVVLAVAFAAVNALRRTRAMEFETRRRSLSVSRSGTLSLTHKGSGA
jgi:hypothetical protein